MREQNCAVCGKPIATSLQYLSIDKPVHTPCWEKHYPGVAYIDPVTRERLQRALSSAHNEFCVLRQKLEELDREHTRSQSAMEARSQSEMGRLHAQISTLEGTFRALLALDEFYNIQPIQNVDSILERGLLCKNRIEALGITPRSFSNPEIQERRAHMLVEGGRSANDYVPLFFSKKPPMHSLISYQRNKNQHEIVYLCIKREILWKDGIAFSDGNVSAERTKIFRNLEDLPRLDWPTIMEDHWNDPDPIMKEEQKRKKSAEILVPELVDPSWFRRIVVHDEAARSTIQGLMKRFPRLRIPVEADPSFYF